MATLKIKCHALIRFYPKTDSLSTIFCKTASITNLTFNMWTSFSSFNSEKLKSQYHFHIVKVKFLIKAFLKKLEGNVLMNTSGINALRMNALMTSLLIWTAITMPLICSYDPMLTRPTCLTLSHCLIPHMPQEFKSCKSYKSWWVTMIHGESQWDMVILN